ncbi:Hypp1577 [Branchiostoma lanceolatum]|uniref:Hypp1577 protein n=1 Tax=Branchiostoma lanceolatum TaxID=7740 RepID=A0A8J9ZLX2_BRALA|nr:Hypp1577 [Branchiostoma lanceolatum]
MCRMWQRLSMPYSATKQCYRTVQRYLAEMGGVQWAAVNRARLADCSSSRKELLQLTMFQIRRQGMQKGTPCQHSQCKCANFCAPSNSSVKSASRQCTECQHLESDHRLVPYPWC